MSSNDSSGVVQGYEAVADELWEQHRTDQHLAKQPRPEGWGETRARAVVNTWMLASNAVGKSETIYDDFYRLRAAARLVIAAKNTANEADATEALRCALIAVGDEMFQRRGTDR